MVGINHKDTHSVDDFKKGVFLSSTSLASEVVKVKGPDHSTTKSQRLSIPHLGCYTALIIIANPLSIAMGKCLLYYWVVALCPA